MGDYFFSLSPRSYLTRVGIKLWGPQHPYDITLELPRNFCFLVILLACMVAWTRITEDSTNLDIKLGKVYDKYHLLLWLFHCGLSL